MLSGPNWIKLSDKVQKRIIHRSTSCVSPSIGQDCLMHIDDVNGDLSNILADWSFKDVHFPFGESKCNISRVLEIVLLSMQENEKCQVQSVLDLCNHIDQSSSKTILTFTIHLKAVTGCKIYHQTPSDLLSLAIHYKTEGVHIFQENKTDLAFKFFSNAIKFLICIDKQVLKAEEKCDFIDQWNSAKIKCHLNLAACQLRSGACNLAIENCTRALSLDYSSVKCLYKRAQCYMEQKDWAKAEDDLNKAILLAPMNRDVRNLLNNVVTEREKRDKALGNSLSKMFSPT